MAAPWEKYQQSAGAGADAGPWTKYAAPAATPSDRVGGAFDAIGQASSAPAQLSAGLGEQAGAPAQVGVAEDVARSAATGLRSGAEGVVGTFGDLNKLQEELYSFLGDKFGKTPEVAQKARELAQAFPLFGENVPSTEDVQNVTNKIVGQPREPQTTAGKYARTIGEFAPAAVAPGGIFRKAASVAVPAIASEAAGQATEGTPLEPYARLGGALAGGVATLGRPQARALKNAAKNAPTPEALKDVTNKLYQTLRDSGIQYDRAAYGRNILTLSDRLRKEGYRPNSTPEVFAMVKDLVDDFSRGTPLGFDDINGLVKVVNEKARGAARDNPALARAFGIVRDSLDNFESLAPLTNTANLPRGTVNELRTAARETALKNIKQRELNRIVQDSDLLVAGEEAGLRNGILKMLRSKKGAGLFKGAERAALLQVAKGRKPLQTLSRFGLDLGSMQGNASFLPALGAGAAATAGGAPAAVALGLAGTAAKSASPRLTKRAFEQAAAAIRSGKLDDPATLKALEDAIKQRQVRALVGGGVATSSASGGGQ